MGDLSDHCYAFPFLGGVLTIIALLCPVAYFISDEVMWYGTYIWMWGLSISRELGRSEILLFRRRPDLFFQTYGLEIFGIIPSLISTIGLVFCAFILISTAQKVKHNNMDEDLAAKIWVIMSILITSLTIFWIISMEFYYADFFEVVLGKIIVRGVSGDQFGFWAYFNPSFGLIAIFISAGITLIGVYVK